MNKPGRILMDVVRAYSASLVAVGVTVPIISALVTVGIYIVDPQVAALQKKNLSLPADLILHVLGLGLFITGLAWLGSALCCIYLATAQGANMHSYSKIITELCRLKARLGIKNELVDMNPTLPFAISINNFSLESGYLFLVATFFGLTPNLIIKSLQQQAEKYTSDIESSSSANQANSNA